MAQRIPPDSPLRRVFKAVVTRAFQELPDLYTPKVAEHLSDKVLGDFVHVDHIYRLRDLEGRRLEDLPEMLHVAADREGPERRLEVDGYIGDFTLFMGGFFPSSVSRRRWGVPRAMVSRVGHIFVRFDEPLDYYAAEGRNAYERAAETARLFCPEDCDVYRPLARHFERYRSLLRRVKSLVGELPQVKTLEGFLD